MTKPASFPVSDIALKNTLTNASQAEEMRAQAANDPDRFWSAVAKRITWSTPFTKVKDVSYDANDLHIRWFHDGKLNACVNCLDRHIPERANETAIIWEGDNPTIKSTSPTPKRLRKPRAWPIFKGARDRARRPGGHLYADDPGGGVRHARLRAHRRCAFCRIRRLLS